MNDLKAVAKSFLLALMLTACGGDDPRYRSTEILERPPILATHKQAADELVIVEDDSIIPEKKHKKGLEDDVYLTSSKPPVINIKQPFDTAWNTISQALTQSEIKITDQVRDKGQYFVSYNPGTLIGMFSSLVTKQEKEVIYVLTVDKNGQETRVTVKKATPAEQSSALEKTAYDAEADDDADALLYKIFETMRDDLLTV
ncbi:outer membrane protein assembly factor BamC [Methylovulum sp.]|uniref:outer membrane protein assembly factor BamC n=1 Tax=Methylovulum sp. TaxID=1916980 RepID=UPI002626164C|nr:outer membrane protein assembly factor BamC [Methylovulum sp.]